MRWYYIKNINPKFIKTMSEERKTLANTVLKSSRWFEFHGELYLFGVKVWDFRIPPQSSSSYSSNSSTD